MFLATRDAGGDGIFDVREAARQRRAGISGTMILSKRCAVRDGCWTTWKIIGIGDFNQDGIDDLFWQNLSTGAIQMSLLNGAGGVTGLAATIAACFSGARAADLAATFFLTGFCLAAAATGYSDG